MSPIITSPEQLREESFRVAPGRDGVLLHEPKANNVYQLPPSVTWGGLWQHPNKASLNKALQDFVDSLTPTGLSWEFYRLQGFGNFYWPGCVGAGIGVVFEQSMKDRVEEWLAGCAGGEKLKAKIDDLIDSGTGLPKGVDPYTIIYHMIRREVFWKAFAPSHFTTHNGVIRLRADERRPGADPDSKGTSHEIEVGMVFSPVDWPRQRGEILGWTHCNDFTCNRIESDNPLGLPQPKTWRQCFGVYNEVVVAREDSLPADCQLWVRVEEAGRVVYTGTARVGDLVVDFPHMLDFVTREQVFLEGGVVSCGTAIKPHPVKAGQVIHSGLTGVGEMTQTAVKDKLPDDVIQEKPTLADELAELVEEIRNQVAKTPAA